MALPWFADVTRQSVMIWKGVGGRELLEHTLRDKGAFVDSVELYRRVMPIYAPNELDQVLIEHAIDIIMITSGEALQNLWQLAEDKTRLINTVLIVPSERVAGQARSLGFHNVLCAKAADDESMLMCLQQYQMQTEANA
jgi:uroporphyrinogen-III synthase